MERAEILKSDYILNQAHKHSTPPSNRIMRNTLRRISNRNFQNDITCFWFYEVKTWSLKNLGQNPYEWMNEFIDLEEGIEHPLFREFIKYKLKNFPIEKRSKEVYTVLKTITYAETRDYCYGIDFEAQKYISTHSEEIIRKQAVVQLMPDNVNEVCDELVHLNNKCIIDGISVQEYLVEGGSLNGYDQVEIVDHSPQCKMSLNELISEVKNGVTSHDNVHFYDNRSERLQYVVNKKQLLTNDVYTVSKYRYAHKNAFPLMLYAPPMSGKTYYNKKVRAFTDTDSMLLWQLYPSYGMYITNMPHLLQSSVFSIAIIPDKCEFERRCKARGLSPSDDWYAGMIAQTNRANVKILSNKYLAELFCKEDSDIDKMP